MERYANAQRHWEELGGQWTPYGRKPKRRESGPVRHAVGSTLEHSGTTLNDFAFPERRIYVAEAAEILAVDYSRVSRLAKTHDLGREMEYPPERRGGSGWPRITLSLYAVMRLAAERDAAKWRKGISPRAWREGPTRKPLVRTKIEAPPGDTLISVKGAASMVGVGDSSISHLVRRGILSGWQEDPGKHGSRLWLSARQVARYRDDPIRQKCRTAYKRGRGVVEQPAKRRVDDDEEEPTRRTKRQEAEPPSDLVTWREEHRIDGDYDWRRSSRWVDRDFGEYFTVRQAALTLGITPQSVRVLRQRGRLQGYRRDRKGATGKTRWWFVRKDDVYNLAAQPEYRRKSEPLKRFHSPAGKLAQKAKKEAEIKAELQAWAESVGRPYAPPIVRWESMVTDDLGSITRSGGGELR